MKLCSRCKALKPKCSFTKRAASKDGLTTACSDCLRSAKNAKYAADPLTRMETKLRVKINFSARRDRDPIFRNAWNAWRTAKEKSKIPPWVKFARDLLPAYRALLKGKRLYDAQSCKNGWIVDHIIPLKGESVSGLHVPSNLQVMRFRENSSKGRHFNEALLAFY